MWFFTLHLLDLEVITFVLLAGSGELWKYFFLHLFCKFQQVTGDGKVIEAYQLRKFERDNEKWKYEMEDVANPVLCGEENCRVQLSCLQQRERFKGETYRRNA